MWFKKGFVNIRKVTYARQFVEANHLTLIGERRREEGRKFSYSPGLLQAVDDVRQNIMTFVMLIYFT